MNKIIQGLWIGPELSVMEQLSITSFLRNGHEYHLYVYDEPRNIPTGTVIKDGNEILPSSSIFQYRDSLSYAGFANFFRYKLILERGGWWVDTDTVCLKAFDFSEAYVFSSELSQGVEVVNSGIFKAPANSEVMAYAWGVCQTKDPKQLVWGETGPKLISEAVSHCGLEQYRLPSQVFCPLPFYQWHKVLEPDPIIVFGESTYAIHLWNERWRATGQDKNAEYDPNCVYEQLKSKYLLQNRER